MIVPYIHWDHHIWGICGGNPREILLIFHMVSGPESFPQPDE